MSPQSRVLFAMAILLTVMGVAGLILRSFAYPLALALAALFGITGALSTLARSSGQRGLLFGFAMAVAFVATYVLVVSGGGPPPPVGPTR